MFWRRGNRRLAAHYSRPAPEPPAGWASGGQADGRASGRAAGGAAKKKRASASASALAFALLRVLGALLAAGLLAAAGYGVFYFVLHSPHFALRTVYISPTRHVTTESLRKRAALPAEVNLFRVDLAAVKQRLAGEPWLRSITLHRELPATLRIELAEHEPVALISLDSLYLVDEQGEVFKRAAPGEYAHLPVITGFGRAAYLIEPELTRGQIRAALLALSRYQRGARRPPIGEAHVDHFIGVTLYTDGGTALRLGYGSEAELDTRLARFDTVWKALASAGQKPTVLFLDNRAHPDQVTVRLAAPTGS